MAHPVERVGFPGPRRSVATMADLRPTERSTERSTEWPTGTLLSLLDTGTRQRLLTLGCPRRYDSGELLLHQGAESRHVLVLVDGWVRVAVSTVDGRRTTLGLCCSGDVVGELAALDARPRSATVVAAVRTVARVIPHRDFLGFLSGDPAVALAFSRSIAGRLRVCGQQRADLCGTPVRTRLARALSDLCHRTGGQRRPGAATRIPISQEELAALVGAAEASVHRELAGMRRSGSIETGYRCVVVRDPLALDLIAGDGGAEDII